MKVRAFLGFMSLTASLLFGGCAKKETPSTHSLSSPETQTIIVGLDDNFPPMGFRDEQHRLVGFDIDLAREACKRMGVAVEFKPIDWSAKEAELNSKRVDVLWNGLTITEERKKKIAFTAPYMENHQIIVVTGKSGIKDKAGLAGKVVGVQEGSSAVQAVEKDAKIRNSFKGLKSFGDNVTALMDLSAGRLDAVVVDEVVGRYYTSKRPGEYIILMEHFGTEDYGVGTRNDDIELLAKLQKALDDMKADGTSARIAVQWFGANIVK
ncbi:amino acid ABC transporter substrate-binding protein [Termitidicoccus mucosus]|uniref:Amino acid ABC transporter substrate-binding protein n=1 Tax=Termitidicoccus mucosus TaxID=1184151 RepID=A0A178IGD7_9BACT|nr:amino acid ABC transporter substrate-binding protein [Opitutaceae bacterium TSB47]